jgi:hypothetical protein
VSGRLALYVRATPCARACVCVCVPACLPRTLDIRMAPWWLVVCTTTVYLSSPRIRAIDRAITRYRRVSARQLPANTLASVERRLVDLRMQRLRAILLGPLD